MTVKQIIGTYRNLLVNEGMASKSEVIDMLKLEDDLPDKHKTDEILDKLAGKIIEAAKEPERKFVERNEDMNRIRMENYKKGLSDIEMAEAEKVLQSTIWHWRKENNLPSNPTESDRINNRRMELYNKGLKDAEIAELEYTNAKAIGQWRRKRKLPNRRKGNVQM
jgi:hypothetical protein